MGTLATELATAFGADPAPEDAAEAGTNVADAFAAADVRVKKFGLDVSPVAAQSITGASTQDQVDSLVAALVALGLATDDR